MTLQLEVESPPEKRVLSLDSARRAQSAWGALSIGRRLEKIRELRHLISEHAMDLAAASAAPRGRPLAETITAEVFPLVEACSYLEKKARAVLAPQRFGAWSHPLWLPGVRSEIVRAPIGVILIVGPGNYPLMLSGIQLLQALVGGNAVVLKPGKGGFEASTALVKLLSRAGFDPDLVTLLPEDVGAVKMAIGAGPDKVIFTGSAETGERVLSQLAPRLIPSVMELSGCDAMIVRADADLDLVVNALRFGFRLNAGETCMAPRRLLVHEDLAGELEARMSQVFAESKRLSAEQCWRIGPAARSAMERGARVIAGRIGPGDSIEGPLILADVFREDRMMREDVFAPALAVVSVSGDADAALVANACPYGLGASVFSRDARAARALADELGAGVVTINDIVLPTAAGHLPFGGRGRSGFGVTRGAEGLQQMTVPKVVTRSRGGFRPAYDDAQEGDERLFSAYLRCANGRNARERLSGFFSCLKHLATRKARNPNTDS